MSFLDTNPAATVTALLEHAAIVARTYKDQSPIRIPSKAHCQVLRAHADFEPLAENECQLDAMFRPHAPGLLGYLRGIPVYYSPVKPT